MLPFLAYDFWGLICCRVAWRFATYGRLQYITAAMLGRWVPKGISVVHQHMSGHKSDVLLPANPHFHQTWFQTMYFNPDEV